jgi:hypothetical protein
MLQHELHCNCRGCRRRQAFATALAQEGTVPRGRSTKARPNASTPPIGRSRSTMCSVRQQQRSMHSSSTACTAAATTAATAGGALVGGGREPGRAQQSRPGTDAGWRDSQQRGRTAAEREGNSADAGAAASESSTKRKRTAHPPLQLAIALQSTIKLKIHPESWLITVLCTSPTATPSHEVMLGSKSYFLGVMYYIWHSQTQRRL